MTHDASAALQQQDNSELCQCGRLRTKIHCPFCGSADARVIASKKWDWIDGDSVPTFMCRRCGERFNQQDWKFRCAAPHIAQARAQKALRKPVDIGSSLHADANGVHKADVTIPPAMMAAMDKVMSMPCGGCGKPRRECICVREE